MLLTVDEVARELRVSVPTIRRIIRDGRLRAVMERGCVRVRREDLEAHVRELPAYRPREKKQRRAQSEGGPGARSTSRARAAVHAVGSEGA